VAVVQYTFTHKQYTERHKTNKHVRLYGTPFLPLDFFNNTWYLWLPLDCFTSYLVFEYFSKFYQ